MTGLTHLGDLQVIPQQLLVVRMCTVLDDRLCTLDGTLTTQVGDTLLRHDDVHIVLRTILMAHERHERADHAALSHRRTCKYRKVRVADEVTRTTDTVHHLRSADMGRVHVTIEVGLNSRIDGDHT